MWITSNSFLDFSDFLKKIGFVKFFLQNYLLNRGIHKLIILVINQIQETKWKYKKEQSYPALFDENHLPYAIASQQIKIPAYVIKQGLVRIDSKSFGVFVYFIFK